MKRMNICVSVAAPTLPKALARIRAANRSADLLELRLDSLPDGDGDLSALMEACRKPVLATVRPRREGGRFRGSERARLGLLARALEAGAKSIDVEFSTTSRARNALLREARKKGARAVLSHHDLVRTPSLAQLKRLLLRMAQVENVSLHKIACTAQTAEDNGPLVSLHLFARRQGIPLIAHSMGPAGRVSRNLSPRLGVDLVFARLPGTTPTAAGQPSVADLRAGRGPAFAAVVGNPIGHSLSPVLHNAAFRVRKLDAVYFAVEAERLDEALPLLAASGCLGLSVTMPFKERALQLADQAEPLAVAIGAANTLVPRKGKLRAFNTDAPALVDALTARTSLRGSRALIIGGGGAAKAAAIGLREASCEVALAVRSPRKAATFCKQNGFLLHSLRALQQSKTALPVDILVNATPLGMLGFSQKLPLPARLLSGLAVVADFVYAPQETPLLRAAAGAHGCLTVPGLELFLGQGLRQFALFTGLQAPSRQVLARALRRRLAA